METMQVLGYEMRIREDRKRFVLEATTVGLDDGWNTYVFGPGYRQCVFLRREDAEGFVAMLREDSEDGFALGEYLREKRAGEWGWDGDGIGGYYDRKDAAARYLRAEIRMLVNTDKDRETIDRWRRALERAEYVGD